MHTSDKKLDYALLGPCVCMVASSYGLARYTYGLFIPVFRDSLQITDATLAFIAAVSYASYFLATLLGIALLRHISARTAVVLGGLFASAGMACIAGASDSRMLALGVVIAGVSPGLAWTPISDIVARHASASRQRRIYAVINSGTSLGVLLGGPVALFYGTQWRLAWAWFAVFGLLSTLWCAWLIPGGHGQAAGRSKSIAWVAMVTAPGLRLLGIAFGIGLATSVYWTFAVDRVAHGDPSLLGLAMDPRQTSQLFWCLVGVAGLGGMVAGSIVQRLGPEPALKVFVFAIALATLALALSHSLLSAALSGLVFGAGFVMMSAALGIWSMEIFAGNVSTGFGLTYLMLSLGQFAGPFLVGLVIGQTSLQTVFLTAALLATAIALLLKGRGRHADLAMPGAPLQP